MVLNKRIVLLIGVSFLGLLLGGCRERTHHNSNQLASIVEFMEARTCEPFADAIASVDLIPIEMDDQHLLGDNVHIYLLPEGFLLADKQNAKLYRYSRYGRFVNAIGRRGNGPGEFNRIGDVQVLGDHIHVYDDPGRELVFSMNGELLENNKRELGIHAYRTGSGILSYYGYSGQKEYRLVYQEENREFYYLELDSKLLPLTLDSEVFSPSVDGGVVFTDSYSPTIYKYLDGEVTPYLSFNLGRYSIKESFFTAEDAFLAAEELLSSNYGIITEYSECLEYKFVQLVLNNLSEERNWIEYGLFNGTKWLWFSFSDYVKEPMPGSLRFLSEGILYGLFTVEELRFMDDLSQGDFFKNALNGITGDDDEYVLAKIRLK